MGELDLESPHPGPSPRWGEGEMPLPLQPHLHRSVQQVGGVLLDEVAGFGDGD